MLGLAMAIGPGLVHAPRAYALGGWVLTPDHMDTPRIHHTATLLTDGRVLVAGGENALGSLNSAEIYNPSTGRWSAAANMQQARSQHTATLLPDGRVLVTGGFPSAGVATSGAEIYDPVSNTWSTTGGMTYSRANHTASLLPDGRIVVTGGTSGALYLASAEIYNPITGTWSLTGGSFAMRAGHAAAVTASGYLATFSGYDGSACLNTVQYYDPAADNWINKPATNRRVEHSATLLPDGRILVTGGYSGTTYLDTALLYNAAGTGWATTGSMSNARAHHTATLLPDGRVLVVGGTNGSSSVVRAEVFNPTAGTWSSAGDLNQGRKWHTATLLADGRVLVVGGWQFGHLQTSEIWDPATPTWSSSAAMSTTRTYHAAVLLTDGRVLVAGGKDNSGIYLRNAGVYNPNTNAWESLVGQMIDYRSNHTLTLLPNGRALVAGGRNASASHSSAQVFWPNALMWYETGSMNQARHDHTATLLPNGQVLVVGGSYVATPVPGYRRSAELYSPATEQWTLTDSLATARASHTATLLPNGQVLIAGGYTGALMFPYTSSAELYDPSSGAFTTVASMNSGRSEHTATLLPDGRVLVVGGRSKPAGSVIYLSSCEIYNPTAGTWSAASSLPAARADHTATLLADGRVLVVGGQNADGTFSTALIYDPAADEWVTVAAAMSGGRRNHSATLLLSGELFIAGGEGANVLATTTRYDRGLGQSAGWRPSVTSATNPLPLGRALEASGSGFFGLSQASGGNGNQDSASGYPLVQLRRLDNEMMIWLRLARASTPTSFQSTPLSGFQPGHALLTVFANGIPSISRVVLVEPRRVYVPMVVR